MQDLSTDADGAVGVARWTQKCIAAFVATDSSSVVGQKNTPIIKICAVSKKLYGNFDAAKGVLDAMLLWTPNKWEVPHIWHISQQM